jgi:hypothetical protein
MNPGEVYFDRSFAFHDGTTGEKLFVVLGTANGVSVVAKTTSKQHGRGTVYGCQPKDRFHNFFLPLNSCYLKGNTWVCLHEFYELNISKVAQKRFSGEVNHICSLEDRILREIQECAIQSKDISFFQENAVKACLVAIAAPSTGGSPDAPAQR